MRSPPRTRRKRRRKPSCHRPRTRAIQHLSKTRITGCPAFAGHDSPGIGRGHNAYRRPRPASLRQGGAGSALEARRERDRRLCRAGEARRQGRSVEGSRARRRPAGAPARVLQGPEGLGRIQGDEARPAGDGVRHFVRAGRILEHPDARLDPVSSVATAGLSRCVRDQLADHQGREGDGVCRSSGPTTGSIPATS